MASSMMLRQNLQDLCKGTGWNYALFWKLRQSGSKEERFFWEGCYHEFEAAAPGLYHDASGRLLRGREGSDYKGLCDTMSKMIYHMYTLGAGLMGQVAFKKSYHVAYAPDCLGGGTVTQFPHGWHEQFTAGIKTIAVAYVPGGLLQLGSLDELRFTELDFKHVTMVFSALQHELPSALAPGFPVEGLPRSLPCAAATTMGGLGLQYGGLLASHPPIPSGPLFNADGGVSALQRHSAMVSAGVVPVPDGSAGLSGPLQGLSLPGGRLPDHIVNPRRITLEEAMRGKPVGVRMGSVLEPGPGSLYSSQAPPGDYHMLTRTAGNPSLHTLPAFQALQQQPPLVGSQAPLAAGVPLSSTPGVEMSGPGHGACRVEADTVPVSRGAGRWRASRSQCVRAAPIESIQLAALKGTGVSGASVPIPVTNGTPPLSSQTLASLEDAQSRAAAVLSFGSPPQGWGSFQSQSPLEVPTFQGGAQLAIDLSALPQPAVMPYPSLPFADLSRQQLHPSCAATGDGSLSLEQEDGPSCPVDSLHDWDANALPLAFSSAQLGSAEVGADIGGDLSAPGAVAYEAEWRGPGGDRVPACSSVDLFPESSGGGGGAPTGPSTLVSSCIINVERDAGVKLLQHGSLGGLQVPPLGAGGDGVTKGGGPSQLPLLQSGSSMLASVQSLPTGKEFERSPWAPFCADSGERRPLVQQEHGGQQDCSHPDMYLYSAREEEGEQLRPQGFGGCLPADLASMPLLLPGGGGFDDELANAVVRFTGSFQGSSANYIDDNFDISLLLSTEQQLLLQQQQQQQQQQQGFSYGGKGALSTGQDFPGTGFSASLSTAAGPLDPLPSITPQVIPLAGQRAFMHESLYAQLQENLQPVKSVSSLPLPGATTQHESRPHSPLLQPIGGGLGGHSFLSNGRAVSQATPPDYQQTAVYTADNKLALGVVPPPPPPPMLPSPPFQGGPQLCNPQQVQSAADPLARYLCPMERTGVSGQLGDALFASTIPSAAGPMSSSKVPGLDPVQLKEIATLLDAQQGDPVAEYDREETRGRKRRAGAAVLCPQEKAERRRPRPRDRQQIQDRTAELRGLIPQSDKCSIDVLYGRTLDHLKFLDQAMAGHQRFREVEEQMMSSEAASPGAGAGTQSAGGILRLCHVDGSGEKQAYVKFLCDSQLLSWEVPDSLEGLGLEICKVAMECSGGVMTMSLFVEAKEGSVDLKALTAHLEQVRPTPAGLAVLPAGC